MEDKTYAESVKLKEDLEELIFKMSQSEKQSEEDMDLYIELINKSYSNSIQLSNEIFEESNGIYDIAKLIGQVKDTEEEIERIMELKKKGLIKQSIKDLDSEEDEYINEEELTEQQKLFINLGNAKLNNTDIFTTILNDIKPELDSEGEENGNQ